MARPQLFDETSVIEQAMQVFWRDGYVATSMTTLLTATGLKPGSFYNTFVGKKDLFLRCLRHYREVYVQQRIVALLQDPHPIQGIETFFLSSFEPYQSVDLLGCLLTNTAAEVGTEDKDIRQSVAKGLNQIEKAFKQRLSDAKAQGLLSHDADVEALALQLLAVFQGFNVVGKITRSKAKLRAITHGAVSSLLT